MNTQHFIILLILGIYFVPQINFAQENEVLQAEVNHDNLGNVTDAFQENFFEALKQKAIENPEKAIEALLICLEIDPKPVVYFELGKNYNSLGKYGKAAISLEKAKNAEPGNEAILTELYDTYYLSKQFDKALPVVETLHEIDAIYAEDLANLYIINQRFNQALVLLDSLDKKWGDSDYRNGLRRQIYAQTNNVAGEIEDLKNRIAQNPQEEQNYLNLIYVYSENGNPEKAFETAKVLLDVNPSSELVHLALYKFYLDENASEKAINSMKILLTSNAIQEGTKYEVLNDFLMFVSKNPSLEKDLMEVIEVFSEEENNIQVYHQLGTFFLENEKKQQALEYFELALEKEFKNFDLIRNTLLLQLEVEKFEEAKNLSEKAIGNYPSQAFLYLINGTALNRLKLFKDAEDILTFGLEFLIDDLKMEADFYLQLANAYSGLGKETKAAEFQKKAAELKKEKINE